MPLWANLYLQTKDWQKLVEPVGATFEQHGGPNAPHVFKFFRRADLELELAHTRKQGWHPPPIEDFPPHMPRSAEDVLMLTRHYIGSRRILQITAVCNFQLRGPALAGQPQGSRPRKDIPSDVVKLMRTQCQAMREQNVITQTAHNWLLDWAIKICKTCTPWDDSIKPHSHA